MAPEKKQARRCTSWQAENLTSWKADKLKSGLAEKLTIWKADKLKSWQTEKRTNWKAEKLKSGQSDNRSMSRKNKKSVTTQEKKQSSRKHQLLVNDFCCYCRCLFFSVVFFQVWPLYWTTWSSCPNKEKMLTNLVWQNQLFLSSTNDTLAPGSMFFTFRLLGKWKRGIFHFQSHFKGKCHFRFLIHWVMMM